MPREAFVPAVSRQTESTSFPQPQQVAGIRPYFEVTPEVLQTIATVLESGQVTNNGPHVRGFEKGLAEYLNVPETVAVSNGTDALLLALMAMRFETGAIILPAYTYIATLNAIVQSGHKPVFCDVTSDGFTMDPDHLRSLIKTTPDLRCVIPVNVFGIPPDLRWIQSVCEAAGTKIVYDNAHGFGVERHGYRFAPEADVQSFSFHATKALPAVEGGLVIAKDPAITARVRRLRNHGLGASLAETGAGINAKMDELRAIIGTNSLRNFPESLARRASYGHRLLESFQLFPDIYRTQQIPKGVTTNFQNLGVCCRPALQLGLEVVLTLFRERGVGVRSYFDPPLYKIPGFDAGGLLPVTESIWRSLISFPIHSRMNEAVLNQIEEAVKDVAGILRSRV
jgi:dTDP-4-amino-4,6-dideoxygalactose transaminase